MLAPATVETADTHPTTSRKDPRPPAPSLRAVPFRSPGQTRPLPGRLAVLGAGLSTAGADGLTGGPGVGGLPAAGMAARAALSGFYVPAEPEALQTSRKSSSCNEMFGSRPNSRELPRPRGEQCRPRCLQAAPPTAPPTGRLCSLWGRVPDSSRHPPDLDTHLTWTWACWPTPTSPAALTKGPVGPEGCGPRASRTPPHPPAGPVPLLQSHPAAAGAAASKLFQTLPRPR